jgi:hypothetical protein
MPDLHFSKGKPTFFSLIPELLKAVSRSPGLTLVSDLRLMHTDPAARLDGTLHLSGDGLKSPEGDIVVYGTIRGDWYQFSDGFCGWPNAVHCINTVYNDHEGNDDFSKFLHANIAHCVALECDLVFLDVEDSMKQFLIEKWGFQVLPDSPHLVRPCV